MILKPSNLVPNGQCYDATKQIIITWQNNGDLMVKFEIEIKNNVSLAQVYASGIINSGTCLFTLNANTLTNGTSYRYRIKVYNSINEYQYSDWYIIKASAIPVVTINTDGVVRNQNALFQANYSQAQGVALKSYRFYLYNEFNDLISMSDELYDGLLQHTFSGLDTIANYYVECQATSQDDLVGTSGKIHFLAVYVQPSSSQSVEVKSLPNKPFAEIVWFNSKQVLGQFKGGITPKYSNAKFGVGVNLATTESVEFVEDVPTTYVLKGWTKKPTGFVGTIVRQENNDGEFIELGYDGSKFTLRIDKNGVSRLVASPTTALPSGLFFFALRGNEGIIWISGSSLIKIS